MKRSFKITLICLLCLALALPFCSCGKETVTTDAETTGTPAETTGTTAETEGTTEPVTDTAEPDTEPQTEPADTTDTSAETEAGPQETTALPEQTTAEEETSEEVTATSPETTTEGAGHTHSYKETVVKEAGCEESGLIRYTCTCGDSYEETVPALGHDLVKIAVFPASAYIDGYTLYKCSRCGIMEKGDIVPKTGGAIELPDVPVGQDDD